MKIEDLFCYIPHSAIQSKIMETIFALLGSPDLQFK
jgi:hypothetical protein